MRYPALLDGKKGAYGIVFPDLPGCHAMGSTIDEAIQHAQDAMADWIDAAAARGIVVSKASALEDVAVPEGSTLLSILLIPTHRTGTKRLNLYLDVAVADTIDAEAERLGIRRKDYVERAVRTLARMGM